VLDKRTLSREVSFAVWNEGKKGAHHAPFFLYPMGNPPACTAVIDAKAEIRANLLTYRDPHGARAGENRKQAVSSGIALDRIMEVGLRSRDDKPS